MGRGEWGEVGQKESQGICSHIVNSYTCVNTKQENGFVLFFCFKITVFSLCCVFSSSSLSCFPLPTTYLLLCTILPECCSLYAVVPYAALMLLLILTVHFKDTDTPILTDGAYPFVLQLCLPLCLGESVCTCLFVCVRLWVCVLGNTTTTCRLLLSLSQYHTNGPKRGRRLRHVCCRSMS